MQEIINKVAASQLIVFDLEDYYRTEKRIQIDISQWLTDCFLLIEKDFRNHLKAFDFSQYQDNLVAINCGTDAIVPAWAIILVTTYVSPFAKKVVLGNLNDLETALYQDILSTIDYAVYSNKPIILKGCSKKPVPESAYILAVQHLQPFAKSIMYGEACSAVPIFKK